MTKKKKRALEQARLQEEQRKAAQRPRVMYGPVYSDDTALPVINSAMKAVQLPPIIQPISLLPYLSDLNINFSGMAQDVLDDFDDDFDDMF